MNLVDALDQRADRRPVGADDQIALPVARNGAVVDLGGAFADHHLAGDVAGGAVAGARPRDPQRPPGAQAGDQLALERSTALDIQGLVDRLVRDPHGLIIGEIDPQPVGDLLRAPRRRPPPVLTARLVPSLPRRIAGPAPAFRRASGPCRRADPARTRAAARWRPASPSSGASAALGLPLRDRRPVLQPPASAWPRFAATRARSSTATGRAAARSRAPPPWACQSAISSRSANDR